MNEEVLPPPPPELSPLMDHEYDDPTEIVKNLWEGWDVLSERPKFTTPRAEKTDEDCQSWRYAQLQHANLRYLDLSKCDFSYADLSYADLSHSFIGGANFTYAKMIGTVLSGAYRNWHDYIDFMQKHSERSGAQGD